MALPLSKQLQNQRLALTAEFADFAGRIMHIVHDVPPELVRHTARRMLAEVAPAEPPPKPQPVPAEAPADKLKRRIHAQQPLPAATAKTANAPLTPATASLK